MKYNYKNLFASQHEIFTAILGEDYFSSLLVDDDLSDSAIILSDKRVYQVGRLYESGRRIHGGGLRVSRGKKIVNLADIRSTASKQVTKPWPGLSLILFGIITAILGLLTDVRESAIIMIIISLAAIGPGIWLLLTLKKRYLIIEYAGGTIAHPVKFITDTELNLFQGIISVEKERVMSGAADLKVCQNCGEKIGLTATICRYCGETQPDDSAEQ